MAVYFVVNATVTDPDKLNEYMSAAMASPPPVPLKILAADNAADTIEGTPAGPRVVLLQFESKEDFRTWYDSEAYQAIIGLRFAATEGFAVLAQGF